MTNPEAGGNEKAAQIEQAKKYVGFSTSPDTDSIRNAIYTYESLGMDTSELSLMGAQTIMDAHIWLLSQTLATKNIRYLTDGIGNNQGYEINGIDKELEDIFYENYTFSNLATTSKEMPLDEILGKVSELLAKIQAYKDNHPFPPNSDYFSVREKLGVDVKSEVQRMILSTFNKEDIFPDTPESKELVEKLNAEQGLTQSFLEIAKRLNELAGQYQAPLRGLSNRSMWAAALAIKQGKELMG
ncbi:MAG TPA: hypothetical protein PK886_03095 [Candidatus Paceibacterota bacterium]|nr:hypothetical protein [Candidatus Paceibacterota bacterium]